ncbi:MAG: RagB/SusD family nutrient uptake outer membrane protein, partial [Muribaculaceae bacterium]|nr:RagB/SusD family nutrient uptake outer membrane protein [Muribaculaceae bacterium]
MKLNNILISLGCAVALSSCSDSFLENKPQGSLSEGVMTSPEAVDLLVNAAYATLSGWTNECGDVWLKPTTNWSFGEVRSDNAYKGGGGEGDCYDIHQMETFDMQANNGNLDGKWFNLYSQISRTTTALKVLDKCTDEQIPNRKIRIAEMKVLRAHFYFELVRLFNQIPYMDETIETVDYPYFTNNEFSRDQHLGRIASDLV